MYPQLNVLERSLHLYSTYWNEPFFPENTPNSLSPSNKTPEETTEPLPNNVYKLRK